MNETYPLRRGLHVFFIFAMGVLLSSCITDVWTGASLIYDRHNVYKQLSDFQLGAQASHALAKDQFPCKGCSVDVAVFNGDILLVGYVTDEALRQEARQKMAALPHHRRIFNALSLGPPSSHGLSDSWITTQIRTQIFADSAIDPHPFKVVTCDQIVYLMGDVVPEEAARVVDIARKCPRVRRVVKLFKYYNLSDKPSNHT